MGQATHPVLSDSMITDCFREVADVRLNHENPLKCLCLSPAALKKLGAILAAAGAVLIVIFVPIRYWMALLGLILLLAGLALRISI